VSANMVAADAGSVVTIAPAPSAKAAQNFRSFIVIPLSEHQWREPQDAVCSEALFSFNRHSTRMTRVFLSSYGATNKNTLLYNCLAQPQERQPSSKKPNRKTIRHFFVDIGAELVPCVTVSSFTMLFLPSIGS
jgi:hypothetical protein